MSKNDDPRNNNEPNIYPSDYIDYTPIANSRKLNLGNILWITIGGVMLSLVILPIVLNFFLAPNLVEYPQEIQEIAQNSDLLANDIQQLKNGLEEAIKRNKGQLKSEDLPRLIDLGDRLENISLELKSIRERLDAEANQLKIILNSD